MALLAFCEKGRLLFLSFLFFAAVCLGSSTSCFGQALPDNAPNQHLQVGLGGVPDLGVQVSYILVRNFYVREIAFYTNVAPRFLGNERNSVQLSGGLGGLIRTFALLRTIGNIDTRGYDLDFGVRFGPGLFFVQDPTRADKNQRFRPFFEPVLRLTWASKRERVFFFEMGTHRPNFRAGLWLPLPRRSILRSQP